MGTFDNMHPHRVCNLKNNENGNDWIIGDIHGCYDQLLLLLIHINFDSNVDRLISVGDLIDRGPDNIKCLELLNKKWFHAVKGNHEDMMAGCYLDGYDCNMWYTNGGDWSFAYDHMHDEMVKWAQTVKMLPLIIVVGKDTPYRYNVVHAELRGVNPVTNDMIDDHKSNSSLFWSSGSIDNMLWGRSLVYMTEGDVTEIPRFHDTSLSLTFCGHTPIKQPFVVGSQVFIDTGCFYANKRKLNTYGLTIVNPKTLQRHTLHYDNTITSSIIAT